MAHNLKLHVCLLLVCHIVTDGASTLSMPTGNISAVEKFVKVLGSTNPNDIVVKYINGTVYARMDGKKLKPLFWLEGYNIERLLPQKNGSYLSLSREFLIYRDFKTRQILQIYQNPLTMKPNEAFPIANDPVNGLLPVNIDVPMVDFSDDVSAYDANYILEYPNPMDPKEYPSFSARQIYDAAELFTYYFNKSDINKPDKSNIPSIVTWCRHSQFLPWLEMGQTKGSLFYVALSWKCSNGLGCVAKDILDIIKAKYKNFLSPPQTFEVPNETSWTVFKKTIDARRHLHRPDIIFPQVPISSNVTETIPYIDSRVQQAMYHKSFHLNFSAAVLTEIYGKQSETLLGIKGMIIIRTEMSKYPQTTVSFNGTFMDPKTNQPISKLKITELNKTVDVPPFCLTENWNLTTDNSYTTTIPDTGSIGLTVASSQMADNKPWKVTMANLIFRELNLSKQEPKIFGVYHRFSSWFEWMQAGNTPGTLIIKALFATM